RKGYTMFASSWIYELMLVVYSFSIIGYFIDFIRPNDRVNKFSFYLLCLVWFSQSIILFKQLFIENVFPILTLNDGLFFYSWILILFSILLNRFFQVHFILLFT